MHLYTVLLRLRGLFFAVIVEPFLPQPVFVDHHQPKDDRKVPQTSVEELPSRLLAVPACLPKVVCMAYDEVVRTETRDCERPVGDAAQRNEQAAHG